MRAGEIVAALALIMYMTVVVGACSYLLVRFRMRAGDLKVRARSPALATLPGVYAILVGGLLIPLQELLGLFGVDYPCCLTLIQSWFFLPVWGAPFALRSLRVIIASDKGRQERLGFLLRKRTTLAVEAFLCVVALVIVVSLSQLLPPYSSGAGATRGAPAGACFMLMEWRFLLPFCILQTIIFGLLGYRLRHVNDLLNISSELRVNFMLYLLFGLPYFVPQLHYRYRTDKNVPTYLQLLISAMVVLAMLNTMWASVGGLEDMFEHLGWQGFDDVESTVGPSSHSGSTGASEPGSPRIMASITRADVNRWKHHYNDVPSIMRNERMSAVFGALAGRFLCSESYDFLVAVSDYRGSTGLGAGPGLQHMLFIDLCKAFVVVNSEQEIDISHEQRANVLQYMDHREFAPLTESERAGIFCEAEQEVAQMLELNLLRTFHNSAAFAETCAAVDVEEHVWQLEEERFRLVEQSPYPRRGRAGGVSSGNPDSRHVIGGGEVGGGEGGRGAAGGGAVKIAGVGCYLTLGIRLLLPRLDSVAPSRVVALK